MLDSVAHPLACPAVGKFSRASSAGGRRHLLKKFVSRIVSVAEDCLSPERTFHGCSQITPLDSSVRRIGVIMLFKFRGANSVAHPLACPATAAHQSHRSTLLPVDLAQSRSSNSVVRNSVAHSLACPAVGKFSRASSAGGRLNLQKKLASQIVSVAEDCLSPERTFHG